jgi:hypothetical protein
LKTLEDDEIEECHLMIRKGDVSCEALTFLVCGWDNVTQTRRSTAVLFPVSSLIAPITRLGIFGGGAPLVQVADIFTRQRIS